MGLPPWVAELGDPPIAHAMAELRPAIEAVGEAAGAVMAIYSSGGGEAREKADGSPVTDADLASHRVVSAALGATGHAVLSEEGPAAARGAGETAWIVDPLDGTSDFVSRTGEFTIMAGLVRSGRPVLGVIAQPAARAIFAAQDGAGSYRGQGGAWERLRVGPEREASECRAVCSRNHLSDVDRAVLSRLGVAETVPVGSSIKACRVAAGEADIYVTTTGMMKQWDTCASWCVVTEAGGRMTDALGGELEYGPGSVAHERGIIASAGGRIHEIAAGECRAALG